MAKPSYELVVGTHTVIFKSGKLTFVSIVAAGADATVSCYDVSAQADIASVNKIAAFKVDVSLNGYQGGGNINDPIDFTKGLVVKVEGVGALAYVAYRR